MAAHPAGSFPALHLYPLDDTFIPKRIALGAGQRVKIARPPNTKTQPGERNGYFDSRVLSRQHAEVWEEGNKIFIKDVKSSNGTFINGERLSLEGRESDPYELKSDDILEFGVDIVSEDNKTVLHRKVVARVACVFGPNPKASLYSHPQHPAPPLPHDQFATISSGSGVFTNSSSPSRRPQQQYAQPQVPLVHALGGMGGPGGGPRAPGRGLTLDHIFNRLQAELAKSREAGRELHMLGGALGGIGESINMGPPTSLPSYPDVLPAVRPVSVPSLPPVLPPPLAASPPNASPTSNSPPDATASSASSNADAPAEREEKEKQAQVSADALAELQSQLRALRADVEALRTLKVGLPPTHSGLQVEGASSGLVPGQRGEERGQLGGDVGEEELGEEDEMGELGEDGDDAQSDTDSIMTATPHELEAVVEESAEDLEADEDEGEMENVSLEDDVPDSLDGDARRQREASEAQAEAEAEALADARRHARAMQEAQDERVEREMREAEEMREREEEREENMRRERAQTPEPSLEEELRDERERERERVTATTTMLPAQAQTQTTLMDTTNAQLETETNRTTTTITSTAQTPELGALTTNMDATPTSTLPELTARLTHLAAQLAGALSVTVALREAIGGLEERVGRMEAASALRSTLATGADVASSEALDEAAEVEVKSGAAEDEPPAAAAVVVVESILVPNGDIVYGSAIGVNNATEKLVEIQAQLESMRAELAAERGKREAWTGVVEERIRVKLESANVNAGGEGSWMGRQRQMANGSVHVQREGNDEERRGRARRRRARSRSGSGSSVSASRSASRSRSAGVETGLVEEAETETEEEEEEEEEAMDVDLGLRFPRMKVEMEGVDVDEKSTTAPPPIHSNGDANAALRTHTAHAHAQAHAQLNLQTAFGVLLLGVAAAAVLWRVKPE
ncbi:hypothetical protein C8F04DRAFT_1175692 [Mycena alexandri]|uniref:FHA domain-containing protein n=1 Tax=Mycena alexandri TaxID=1745969 RepID=A0AAD6XAZ5_9AGAR|nr:hypothetical protein C8F04DRAFT_1175692 [Mycena alexandri]